jgi:hypothetical protein
MSATSIDLPPLRAENTVDFFLHCSCSTLNLSAYPWSMDKELSEHTYKANDKDALAHLKQLKEFTTPNNLRKSLQTCFFAYLSEQAQTGQDGNFKQVIEDYFFLFEFLDKIEVGYN